MPGWGWYNRNRPPVAGGEQIALPPQAATQPAGYQRLDSPDLMEVAQLDVPEGAVRALIQSTGTQAVRWLDTDADPEPMMGMRLVPDTDPMDYAGDLSALRFIAEMDGAVLEVSYYR